MSFYFLRALRSMKKAVGDIKAKKLESDLFIKKLQDQNIKLDSDKSAYNKFDSNMDSNPFFILHKYKSIVKDKLNKISASSMNKANHGNTQSTFKFEDKIKDLGKVDSKGTFNKLVSHTKEKGLALLESISGLIKRITFGYVDFGQNFSKELLFKKFKENRLVLFFSRKNMLAKYNQSKAFMVIKQTQFIKYMERYKNTELAKKVKSRDYKKIAEEFSKKGSFKERFSQMKFVKSARDYFNVHKFGRIEEMKNYINSPKYKQKFYEYKHTFNSFFKERRWNDYYSKFQKTSVKDIVVNVKSRASNFTFSSFKYWLKKKFLWVLMLLTGFYAVIYFFKYLWEQLKHRRLNKQLKETYDIIAELKEQNKKIQMTNEELLRELQKEKRK